MRFDQLTAKSQEALAEAHAAAERAGHPEVEPEHLLKALLDQKGGTVGPVLEVAKVPRDRLVQALDERLQRLPRVTGARQTVVSATLSQILENSLTEAQRLQDEYVSTEHLLLSLVDPG